MWQHEHWLSYERSTVKSVELIELENPVPTYCITVEDTANFALSAGCFVHNCDGDQMAIHLMLSEQSKSEVNLMRPSYNTMNSDSWDNPLLSPSHEQLVGLYIATR